MPALSKCPNCRLELGDYVETHCPQCGVNLTPKPPISIGIRLLDVMIAICGTLLILASMYVLTFYTNSSSRAELYEGAPYHATTFRVTNVQYFHGGAVGPDGATQSHTNTSAIGIVEGQKESMDLWPYLNRTPTDQYQLMEWVPEGSVIPVYLFPTLKGQNRIQLIRAVPTAEVYQRQATWAPNRALPALGGIGILTALLTHGRLTVSRNRTVAN